MKAAVIGLGVEGKKASKSLLDHGWRIYATDLEIDIDLEELQIPVSEAHIFTAKEKITISSSKAIIDLGHDDNIEIDNSDAVVLSPSLWKSEIAKKITKSGKLISDVLTNHKKIFTIGITGTNGKTTTSLMLKEILENTNKKVLIGGNAGGGFGGYCDLILEAENNDYDVLIIEVCDMTLDFCNYTFDFDLIGLTNIGNDHINVHGSIENYKNSLKAFAKNKTIFIDENQDYFDEFEDNDNKISFSESDFDLKLSGNFNKLNAGLATTIAKKLNIDNDIIKNTLENFEPVEGRLKVFNLNDSKVYIGKSDNTDAVKSILGEEDFFATFIGTPRSNERHRFEILDVVSEYNPKVIVLFPGLENTIDHAVYKLNYIGYEGKIEIANSLDDIIELLAEYSHENAIFIGGNGQETIIEIQNRVELLSKSCESKS
jgi:UDP-N-acetylmuramoylalanine--D-glutamate ligase